MALSNLQKNLALVSFARAFAACDEEKRRDYYHEFKLAFGSEIKDFDNEIHDVFIKENIPEKIVFDWQHIKDDERNNEDNFTCEILCLNPSYENEVEKLLWKELRLIPCFGRIEDVGTVKDFAEEGFSFIAKKDDEVIGVILAQKVMEYGFYYIFVNAFAVKNSAQGKGVGKKLMNNLFSIAKENHIMRIDLGTEKRFKAYDIYRKWGFKEQDPETVFLSKRVNR
ncbi:Predicted N-acetyltransferase YhbS [Lachnospiraceae bacterium KH1T2]|nr:Predicted N-acetyltransferase YhbS [Lachnospiraceae bacterium KH1T2]